MYTDNLFYSNNTQKLVAFLWIGWVGKLMAYNFVKYTLCTYLFNVYTSTVCKFKVYKTLTVSTHSRRWNVIIKQRLFKAKIVPLQQK